MKKINSLKLANCICVILLLFFFISCGDVDDSNSNSEFRIWMFLTTFIAVIFTFFALRISKKKPTVESQCPKCGKLGALQEIDRVYTSCCATIVTKSENGDVIGKTEVPMPATKYYYNVHVCCQFCEHKEIWETSAVSEN